MPKEPTLFHRILGGLAHSTARDRQVLELSEKDILGQLADKEGSELLLGRYSQQEIRRALDRAGIIKALAERGFKHPVLVIGSDDPYLQDIRVYNEREVAEQLLAEIRLREFTFRLRNKHIPRPGFDYIQAILVEWLLLQNPIASFTAERPRLPGQNYPGLGMARYVIKLLMLLAERHKKDGIINRPESYHNAYLYLKYFHFYNPAVEGRVRAISRDLKDHTLAEISWAIAKNCLMDAHTGEPVAWSAEEQICPISKDMKDYFEDPTYKRLATEAYESHAFSVDWDRLKSSSATAERT